MDERRKELLDIVGEDTKLLPFLEEILFLEEKLVEVKKLPFIRVNPEDPAKQKSTPAAKLYKELLQQYNNCIRILLKLDQENDSEEESPLRKWVMEHGTK